MNTGKTIDAKLAREFVKSPNLAMIMDANAITDEAAEILAKTKEFPFNQLRLDELRELSSAAARSLVTANVSEIWLGLRCMSDETAERLSSFNGSLYLQELTELTEQSAREFSNHKGDLYLDRLKDLPGELAAFLSKSKQHRESRLDLNGLKELSSEGAYHLGTHLGYTELKGLRSFPDDVAESLAKGILESDRREQDFVVLTTYKDLGLSESAALCLSNVFTFLLLNDDDVKKVETALKNYARTEARLKPKETAEIREVLEYSDSPEEIRRALESLEELEAGEADWLKVMFSKNTLRRLMKIDPEDLDPVWHGPPPERQPVWQALAENLGKYPKTLEWFKWEAVKYFKHGDFAEDLAKELTPELVPIVGYGTRRNGITYPEPDLSEEKAALLSSLACPIRFTGMRLLRPEIIRALSNHRFSIEFWGITELDPESAEALSNCLSGIRFEPILDDTGEKGPLLRLPDKSAKALAKGRFDDLYLELEPISQTATEALSSNPRISTNLDH